MAQRRRRHLLIRAYNTRPPGTTLRDQFIGPGASRGSGRQCLTRADVEAALRLEPGTNRSERLLGSCFPPPPSASSREGCSGGGWALDAEAFVAWLEHGRMPLPPPAKPSTLALVVAVAHGPRTRSADSPREQPREPVPVPLPLPLPDSDNEAHPLRRRPHWRKREVVVEERLVEYTTVDAAGAAQSLVERERTVTEVVHWEAPGTGEAAHRERVRYQQREAFDGAETGASVGEEEYVHVVNAAQETFESLRSALPDRYYEGRGPQQQDGEQPPPQQHRRQRSQRCQRQGPEQEGEGEGGERKRLLSPPVQGWR